VEALVPPHVWERVVYGSGPITPGTETFPSSSLSEIYWVSLIFTSPLSPSSRGFLVPLV